MNSGILPIDKPEGPTSAHVVRRVKRILGARKVGHLGTLDPFASGLLLVGINEGTKIAHLFLNAAKSYSGTIALGTETDTQDLTGKVIATREVPPLGAAELERLRAAFIGPLRQLPPMYSALKKQGVPLYRLARQGKDVPRTARDVTIDRLRLWRIGESELGLEVSCSKGTYIRTLAADMGASLGCGAHLKSLRRLTCGHLDLNGAISLEALESSADRAAQALLPLAKALGPVPKLIVDAAKASRLRAGQQGVLWELGLPDTGNGVTGLLDGAGRLVALAQWVTQGGEGRWQLLRVFAPEEADL